MVAPNVLLIVLDSVRARNLGLHGYERSTTPTLSALAGRNRWTWFPFAFAPGRESHTSHTSIFTGYHVHQHRIHPRKHSVAAGHTIWERLHDHGYETGLFTTNPFLSSDEFGLNRGFETEVTNRDPLFTSGADPREFDSESGETLRPYLRFSLGSGSPVRTFLNGVALKLRNDKIPGEYFVQKFTDWQVDRTAPWAACLNLMDAHTPYLPDREHNRWATEEDKSGHERVEDHVWTYRSGERSWDECRSNVDLYDGAIRQTDALVKEILDHLRAQDELSNTLIVVTADHGEGFGEESRLFDDWRIVAHSHGLHEVQTHVPLLVRVPESCQDEVNSTRATLATPTGFPRAVSAIQNGSDPTTAFVSEDGVPVASIKSGTSRRAQEYGFDGTEWNGWAVGLAIPSESGRIRYELQWSGQTASVAIESADDVRDRSPTATVQSQLESMRDAEDVGVRVPLSDQQESLSETTEERLRRLGYM